MQNPVYTANNGVNDTIRKHFIESPKVCRIQWQKSEVFQRISKYHTKRMHSVFSFFRNSIHDVITYDTQQFETLWYMRHDLQ